MDDTLLWPAYTGPEDLEGVEAVPLEERGLPGSVYAVLAGAAALRPDAVATSTLRSGAEWDDPEHRTFAELHAQVVSAANALHALGVGRRDAVALMSVNSAELVAALLAAETVGIASPVNPALAEHDVRSLLERSGARVLVASGPDLEPAVWQRARALAASLGLDALLALHPTSAVQGTPLEPVDGVTVAYLSDLAAAASPDALAFAPPQPDDVVALFHTGGTTGTPKLAGHTHRMQVLNAWVIAAGASADPDATFFAGLPLFHVNAVMVTLLAPVLRAQRGVWAGPLGYRDPALIGAFWRIVERYRITCMSGVPTVYTALCTVPVDADISTLELPIVGAAPLPRAVLDRWLEHTGVPLCEGYGLTEGTCASARNFAGRTRPGTVGQRFPYHRIATARIDEESGEWTMLGTDEVGNVVFRGPSVFPGYVVGRSADGPVFDAGAKVRDGWLDTGDLGRVSADGYVTLVGRAKDIIIRGGHNIDPGPVESVLLTHPAVADAGVVGRPDARAGEVPVAFVVLRDPGADLEEIRAHAAAGVPEPAAAPASVTALSALPVTVIGKPDKVALRVLATRAELGARLAEAGYAVPADDTWCTARDGLVTIVLPAPDATALRAELVALLERYSVAWTLVEG